MDSEEFARRNRALVHAMQSGVAAEHAMGSRDGEPKHLRVGVNVALVEASAVARLLIEKGVFTMAEYQTALIVALETEVASYEERLTRAGGGARVVLS